MPALGLCPDGVHAQALPAGDSRNPGRPAHVALPALLAELLAELCLHGPHWSQGEGATGWYR